LSHAAFELPQGFGRRQPAGAFHGPRATSKCEIRRGTGGLLAPDKNPGRYAWLALAGGAKASRPMMRGSIE